MVLHHCRIFWILSLIFEFALCGDTTSNELYSEPVNIPKQHAVNSYSEQIKAFKEEDIVNIQDFYESLCPGCREFIVNDLIDAVKRLGNRIDVHCYPYGNAETIEHEDGTYEFICQHGPEECYGNMLHACALDLVKNHSAAILFNACLMDLKQENGSDDATADKCGKEMNIDSEAIKTCAKGPRGKELHKHYGEESKKNKTGYVPYILINEVEFKDSNFFKTICKAFKSPPKECN